MATVNESTAAREDFTDMMLVSQERLLASARAIVAQVATHLQGDLSVQLWNGEVLPLGDGARDDIRIVIASPLTVRKILLRPSLRTLFELYTHGDVDIVGGHPLEAAGRWDHGKALKMARRIDRKAVLMAAWPFLLAGRRLPGDHAPRDETGIAFDAAVPDRPEAGRDDQALIAFHYDVSNAFYALFLDPEMVYSCGYFRDPSMGLAEAQQAKLDHICRKLRLKPGERLLDIGCGWGGLVCHAARHYGVIAHGVTLSQAQYEFAQAKIASLGLQDRVTVELRDYRSIEGAGIYDKIAQIEMFEHLGLDNHDAHFERMHGLLKPRGLYLHQASTRNATRDLSKFRVATRYQGIISRFVFPGGELDHIGLSVTNLERFSFEVHDVENLREHFEKTLRIWSERLWANRDAAIAEVGLARTRLWHLYFAMCALGFYRSGIGVFQTLASKRAVGASGLPPNRDHLAVR